MKLTRLELTNFRSARGLTLDLDAPRILITGVNGSGKTSVREGIRYLLRGLSEVTDQRGSGVEALAPYGTSDVAVKGTLAGIGDVSRMFSAGGGTAFSVEGFTGTSGTQQQALYAKLNTSPEFLDCCLDGEAFFKIHTADAKRIVLNLLNVKVGIPSKQDATLINYLTLDEIEVQYKAAFEQRKEAKRRLQTTAMVPTVVLPEAIREALTKTQTAEAAGLLPLIDERLTALRGQVGTLRQGIGEVIGRRTALESERVRVAALTGKAVPDTTADEALLERLRKTAPEDIPAATPGQQVVQLLRSKEEALGRHVPSGGCVLDAEVPCKTPLKFFAQRAVQVGQEFDVLRKQMKEPATPVNHERELNAVQDRLRAAMMQKAAIEQAGGRLAEIDEDLSSLPETTAQEKQIADIESAANRGIELQRQVQAYLSAKAVAEAQDEARQKLIAEVNTLEERVEQLGPKGLRVAALRDAIGRFEAAINPYLSPWGWQISIEAEPWTVEVNGREWITYSRSERYRIGIAIQFALAQLSGLSFALVDEADMLDAEKRGALAAMVQAAPLEQVIMFATREPSQALPAPLEGWIFIRLASREGQSVVQEAVALKGAA